MTVEEIRELARLLDLSYQGRDRVFLAPDAAVAAKALAQEARDMADWIERTDTFRREIDARRAHLRLMADVEMQA
ncbi:MAG: hypothetical protein NVS1B6_08600 [Steroidobacteraceae bacterium]